MNFKKQIPITKGVTLNISKSETKKLQISLTVGIRGLNVNISKKGIYVNVSLPGTGIYDRRKIIDFGKHKEYLDVRFEEVKKET